MKAVRFPLKVNYGQLRRAESSAGKNPHPSYLWACTVFLPASAQSTLLLFFSVTLFAIHPQLAHCFFSFLKKINKPIHTQAKKKSGTPTATTVPEMRQKKKQLEAMYT
ncbi:MAG: hypothetical protein WCK78_01875 [Paludibacter sp.]